MARRGREKSGGMGRQKQNEKDVRSYSGERKSKKKPSLGGKSIKKEQLRNKGPAKGPPSQKGEVSLGKDGGKRGDPLKKKLERKHDGEVEKGRKGGPPNPVLSFGRKGNMG